MNTSELKKRQSEGGKRSKRKPDTLERLIKRIEVKAEDEGKVVSIEVKVK